MTPPNLEEWKRLLAAATPGPVMRVTSSLFVDEPDSDNLAYEFPVADAYSPKTGKHSKDVASSLMFILNNAPALIARVEELERRLRDADTVMCGTIVTLRSVSEAHKLPPDMAERMAEGLWECVQNARRALNATKEGGSDG